MIVRLLKPRDGQPAGAIVSYGIEMARTLVSQRLAAEYVEKPELPKKTSIVRDEKKSVTQEPADAGFHVQKEK